MGRRQVVRQEVQGYSGPPSLKTKTKMLEQSACVSLANLDPKQKRHHPGYCTRLISISVFVRHETSFVLATLI